MTLLVSVSALDRSTNERVHACTYRCLSEAEALHRAPADAEAFEAGRWTDFQVEKVEAA